ncbi:MAG: hypothetical protein AAFW76_05310, partial [Pseudomonadota bacterium]
MDHPDVTLSNRLRRALAATTILAASLAPITAQARDVTIGQTFLASGLDPAEGSNGWAVVSHGIGEQLFRVSREGEVVPNLASSATAAAVTGVPSEKKRFAASSMVQVPSSLAVADD